VRVIATAKSPAAPAVPTRSATPVEGGSTVLRPVHLEQLTEAVDVLRSGRSVSVVLDGFTDAADRQRALAFVRGAAYALGTDAAADVQDDTIVLEPCAPDRRPRNDAAPQETRRSARKRPARGTDPRNATCVLCDLRTADREFEPRLEMVIRRDGSRIWSPPAMVCSHCRTTIRHWQFALAWCSECERWGRRNVVSPCGQLYG
jgi:Cell division protein SepF